MAAASVPGLSCRIRFAGFELDRRAGELRRDGEKIHLSPQVWRLLDLLVERAGELVSREEIRERLWGEAIFVEFDLGLNHCVSRLRAALGDPAHASRFILTLPCRGYRFVAPIDRQLEAVSPSLAVLPFVNLDGDCLDDPLADGMTEAVLTALARDSRLRVLSRQSVLHLKRSERTLPEIGSELGVEAIVEGSTFRAAGCLRVFIQLVWLEPERHLWAGAYEGRLEQLFALERKVEQEVTEAVPRVLLAHVALGLPPVPASP